MYPQIIATKGVIKLTVEVKEAPDSLINLKNKKPPIAVFKIPKIRTKNKLWFEGYKLKGFSKRKAKGTRIKKAKKVEPVKINKGLNFLIFLA
tara:strand:+ start:229 stop:504 length:276 start_codon:yes stop_codon:yes gene_type:complete